MNCKPKLVEFTRMPYSRWELMTSIKRIAGERYVADAIKLGISFEVMILYCQMVMFIGKRSPYAPSCRVIREASIDLELRNRLIFSGESG